MIPAKYDDVLPFEGGIAAVKLGKKWGFVNKKGKQVLPIKYDINERTLYWGYIAG